MLSLVRVYKSAILLTQSLRHGMRRATSLCTREAFVLGENNPPACHILYTRDANGVGGNYAVPLSFVGGAFFYLTAYR